MLELPDSWVWDSWFADTGTEFHVFFLFASRALGDPERRHGRASIGHAVSTDLTNWTRLPDAVVRSDAPAVDDAATWTGCTIRDGEGRWHLFYTALSHSPVPYTQRVTAAVSDDLVHWTPRGRALATADPRWYRTAERDGDEPFRDPWVVKADDGRWHMLLSASAADAPRRDEGVVGHAVSENLVDWEVLPPLTQPGAGFGQLEVTQTVRIGDRWYLIFSCLDDELADRRRAESPAGGVWIAPAEGPVGPFHLDRARVLDAGPLYAARIVADRDGHPLLLGFENMVDGRFVGRLSDPIPARSLVAEAMVRDSTPGGA